MHLFLWIILFCCQIFPSCTESGLNCSYGQHVRTLVCRCGQDGDNVITHILRLDKFTEFGLQEIESVIVEFCPNLQLALDFININASSVKLSMRKCNKISINFIAFETNFANRQSLGINFNEISEVKFSNLHVNEKLKLNFNKVKFVAVLNSEFLSFSKDDVSSVNSGPICINQTILNLKTARLSQPLTICPWISPTKPKRPPKFETSLSLPILKETTKESSILSTQDEIILVTPLMCAVVVVTIICVIVTIASLIILSLNELSRRKHSSYKDNIENLKMFQAVNNFIPKEDKTSKITEVEINKLKRSISAILLYKQNLETTNSASFKNIILAKEEEFLF